MRLRFRRGGAGLRLAAILLSLAPLGGCGIFDSGPSGTCPVPEIVGQLGTLKRFHGDPGNAANLAYAASLSNLQSDCSFDDDGVTVSFNVTLIANIGPAANIRTAEFPYFVAVTGPGGRVVAEQDFGGAVTFPATKTRVGATDSLTERIPMRDARAAQFYRIYVGFRLTPAELAYNRTHVRP